MAQRDSRAACTCTAQADSVLHNSDRRRGQTISNSSRAGPEGRSTYHQSGGPAFSQPLPPLSSIMLICWLAVWWSQLSENWSIKLCILLIWSLICYHDWESSANERRLIWWTTQGPNCAEQTSLVPTAEPLDHWQPCDPSAHTCQCSHPLRPSPRLPHAPRKPQNFTFGFRASRNTSNNNVWLAH